MPTVSTDVVRLGNIPDRPLERPNDGCGISVYALSHKQFQGFSDKKYDGPPIIIDGWPASLVCYEKFERSETSQFRCCFNVEMI